MEQPILSSGGLQASVDLGAGRGHPNGESESCHANRSGPDRSATLEANPTNYTCDLNQLNRHRTNYCE